MSTFKQTVKTASRTFENFVERGTGMTLRPYQIEPAQAILESIRENLGMSFVVIISRQAGKDELFANLYSYLLMRFAHEEAGMVVVNPTYKPQTINAMERLDARLSANLMTRMHWRKRADFMRFVHRSRISFLSGDATSNVVGATASLLLVVNEAQDIAPAKFDKDFSPMTASTNATRVYVGTSWTKSTLLSRERRNAEKAQDLDGKQRVFIFTADDVRKFVQAYGKFVDAEIKKHGRNHPLIKSQYFCEEIDEVAGMFNAARIAILVDNQPAPPCEATAFLIDVAGMDEALLNLDGMGNPGRDNTALDVIGIDLSRMETTSAPVFHITERHEWKGRRHTDIFGIICALHDKHNPQYIVIDATGVGEGLWDMLSRRYPGKVIPVKYTQQVKSGMGYHYLSMIDTGRVTDHCHTPNVSEQYSACQSEILIGPAKTMRWGVPEGTRDQQGELIHDDFVTCDALVTVLDNLQWYISGETTIIPPNDDDLKEMDYAY